MSYKNVQFHLGHLSLQNLMQKKDLNKPKQALEKRALILD